MEIDRSVLSEAHLDTAKSADCTLSLEAIPEPVHFVGIGGIGMSALARLLIRQGKKVSGSDKQGSPITDELAEMGAVIHIGHQADNVNEARSLVISTAIVKENPELARARERNLPVWHRSQILAALAQPAKNIAVTGTHGKTTTTGMVAQVLIDGGLDPSVVVGGIFNKIRSNARHGEGGYFVAEADESDGTHATFVSEIAVITNIEPDHLENYPGGINQIYDTMVSFANRARRAVLLCADDPGCQSVIRRIDRPVVTYGAREEASSLDYSYECMEGFSMRVFKREVELGSITLSVPGEHNKQNALAAVAIGMELGIDFSTIERSLNEFGGVDRRFQIIGKESGILVVDDYAHHPTEVIATLKAARQYLSQKDDAKGEPRVVAVFQPHQPGRLKDLWNEFLGSFDKADLALICDIYVARGGNIEGITSERFVSSLSHPHARHVPGSVKELPGQIAPHLRPGDLVLTIGAGDITNLGALLIEHLKDHPVT